MTNKVHIATNKGLNGNPLVARCAGRVINGRINRNGRRSYQFMASEIMHVAEFRLVDRKRWCSHCVEIANARRAAKGMDRL